MGAPRATWNRDAAVTWIVSRDRSLANHINSNKDTRDQEEGNRTLGLAVAMVELSLRQNFAKSNRSLGIRFADALADLERSGLVGENRRCDRAAVLAAWPPYVGKPERDYFELGRMDWWVQLVIENDPLDWPAIKARRHEDLKDQKGDPSSTRASSTDQAYLNAAIRFAFRQARAAAQWEILDEKTYRARLERIRAWEKSRAGGASTHIEREGREFS